jgi:phosphate transport system permease protein
MTMLQSNPTSEAGVTTLPADASRSLGEPPDLPRPIRGRTFDDWACLFGSVVGSFAFVWLVYENILPFSGLVGFVICWYLSFVAAYAGVTALTNPSPVVVDRVVSAAVQGAAATTAIALGTAIAFPFVKGYHAIVHLNFYTHDMSGVAPTDPLTKGGQLHAILGSLIEIGIAVSIVLPLGIGAAVYMTEVGGRFARVVRTIVEAMTALPSIVAGLFIYAILIIDFHFPKSGLAAALAMSVMGLPIIARASDVVLRVVPGGLREASLALGSSKWQTVWRVVIPTARPGLATALILSVARMIGETSPVLLTSGTTTYTNVDPISGLMNSMPLSIYASARSGEPLSIERGYGLAAVLLGIVLILFITARLLSRQRTSR